MANGERQTATAAVAAPATTTTATYLLVCEQISK